MDFCFVSNEYYKDFADSNIMINKEKEQGKDHNRPCFIAFEDDKNNKIKWVVPLSTKYEKYKAIYEDKITKRGRCDTIHIAEFMGKKQAFLLQNMIPITEKYILNYYVDKNQKPILISGEIKKAVQNKAQRVINKQKEGVKLIFPDVNKIYKTLELQLSLNKEIEQQRPKPRGINDLILTAQEKSKDCGQSKNERNTKTPSSIKLEGVFDYKKEER